MINYQELLDKAKAIQQEAMREGDSVGFMMAGQDIAYYEMMLDPIVDPLELMAMGGPGWKNYLLYYGEPA